MSEHGSLRPAGDGVPDGGGSGTRTVTISDVLRVVRRRWRPVASGGVLGVMAIAAYLAMTPPTYVATAEVALRLPVINTFTYPGAGADRIINMNVEESLAASEVVISDLAELTGRSHDQVRESLSVESPVGGQKLRFTYAATSEEAAALGADAAASAYLELRRGMYDEQRVDLVGGFDEDIAQVTADLAATQSRIDNLPSESGVQSPQATAALAELSALRTELAALREEQSRVRTVDVTPGWVTRNADQTPSSSHDRMALLFVAGLAGGLLAGAVMAVMLESFNRRVRSVAEATAIAGVPLIGQIRRRGLRVPAAAVDADVRYTSFALAATVDGTPKPIVLISPQPDEGRTRLVAGLAVALAATGRDVEVVSMTGRTAALQDAVLAGRERFAGVRFTAKVSQGGRNRPAAGAPVARPLNGKEPVAVLGGGADDDTVLLPALSSEVAETGGSMPDPRAAQTRVLPGASGEDTLTGSGVAVNRRQEDTIAVADGGVRVRSVASRDPGELTIVDAPAAEVNAQGVHAAREGVAVVVAAQDRTRVAELRRLVERLHGVGSEPVGVILTGG